MTQPPESPDVTLGRHGRHVMLPTPLEGRLLAFLATGKHRGWGPVELSIHVEGVREDRLVEHMTRLVRYGFVTQSASVVSFTTSHLPKLRWQATETGVEASDRLALAGRLVPVLGAPKATELPPTAAPIRATRRSSGLPEANVQAPNSLDPAWGFPWVTRTVRGRPQALPLSIWSRPGVEWAPLDPPDPAVVPPPDHIQARVGYALALAYPSDAMVAVRSLADFICLSRSRVSAALQALARDGIVVPQGVPVRGWEHGLCPRTHYWATTPDTLDRLGHRFRVSEAHTDTQGAGDAGLLEARITGALENVPPFTGWDSRAVLAVSGDGYQPQVDPILLEAVLFRVVRRTGGLLAPEATETNGRTVIWGYAGKR